ncbi:MAG: putative DNA modification/repair radical SAM protein [Tepidisphaeraceae bacterium]
MSDVIRKKLAILADAAKYDASCASSGSQRKGIAGGLGNTNKVGICHSYTPDGRCVSLLKILLTNHCIYDCQYCINRVTSNVERTRFTVDEVVKLTIEFYRRNYIEGLFLSSGIIQSVDYTMQQLADVAKTLRDREKYNGYIHLKAIPGASQELIDQAGLYADRLSANIELPTQSDLDRFAPEKKVADVENTMAVAAGRIAEYQAEKTKSPRAPRFAPGGQSTQLIVGTAPAPTRRFSPRPRTFTARTSSAASITRPSARSPTATPGCPSPPPRSSANTASTRPTGSCGSTASGRTNSPRPISQTSI